MDLGEIGNQNTGSNEVEVFNYLGTCRLNILEYILNLSMLPLLQKYEL